MHAMNRLPRYGIAALTLWLCACAGQPPARHALNDIEHIIVIYAENRSFDNLYGLFPGADGIRQATPEQYTQIDHDGKPFAHLPPIWGSPIWQTPTIAANLPNQPFQIDAPPVNLPPSVQSRDLVHRFYQNIEQINGGLNNRFAAVSDAGGLVMGYYDGAKLPMWRWAQDYVLADHFFMAAYGGSYLNHQWLICACTPVDRDAPFATRARIDHRGVLQRKPESPASALIGPPVFFDGALSPDGYTVNSAQPPYQPSGIPPAANGDPRLADAAQRPLPPQQQKTIGDTLTAQGVSWAWYAGAWNAASADAKAPNTQRKLIYTNKRGSVNFQPHHHPFNYYARFAPGQPDRIRHLKDGEDFFAAVDSGDLPQVAFYKPTGDLNEHPGYTDVLSGDRHIADLLARIRRSPLWPTTAVIVTYDENGGFWDHVPPPKGDRWGPGTRIPTIIASPFAKRGYVDHTVYDTTSIIKFITRRFGLEPLPGVRATAGDLTNAFDFE